MFEHNSPYTKIGSEAAGWMTLCAGCSERIKPFFSEAKMAAVQELNEALMGRLQQRFDDGTAGQEEGLLASTFGYFTQVDLVETVKNVEFHEASDESTCLFSKYQLPQGNSKEEVRARAVADRMTAAYKDLMRSVEEGQDEAL